MGKLVYAVYASVKPKVELSFLGVLSFFLKQIEILGCEAPIFGKAYNHLFYKKMVAKEIHYARINSVEKIAHIGCGSLPLTAVELAVNGNFVEAVDIDEKAVKNAQAFLQKFAAKNSFNVKLAEGSGESYCDVKAVWVSLNVYPKELILRKIYSSLKKGGKIVYRNPRGFNSLFYPKVEPMQISTKANHSRFNQSFGKETVIITKT